VLVVGGPATAARLARDVPGAPGGLSYHLRQLATHTFIEEAPELASDGRERWWRAIPGGIQWSDEDLEGSPRSAGSGHGGCVGAARSTARTDPDLGT